LDNALDRAIEIIKSHRTVHEKMAQLLLQKETLEGAGYCGAARADCLPAPSWQRRTCPLLRLRELDQPDQKPFATDALNFAIIGLHPFVF
jgi:hypothetical protein